MLANLKIIWQFHAHSLHQNRVEIFWAEIYRGRLFFRAEIYRTSSQVRKRPFNLKGVAGYGFLFRSEIYFRTTQFFFQNITFKLYDKKSESDYFFFLHQNQNIFFSNIGNQNIFFRKKTVPPPFKLNGRLVEEKKII
jgi:hypothetical protein